MKKCTNCGTHTDTLINIWADGAPLELCSECSDAVRHLTEIMQDQKDLYQQSKGGITSFIAPAIKDYNEKCIAETGATKYGVPATDEGWKELCNRVDDSSNRVLSNTDKIRSREAIEYLRENFHLGDIAPRFKECLRTLEDNDLLIII